MLALSSRLRPSRERWLYFFLTKGRLAGQESEASATQCLHFANLKDEEGVSESSVTSHRGSARAARKGYGESTMRWTRMALPSSSCKAQGHDAHCKHLKR